MRGAWGGSEHFMTACLLDTALSASRWTIFTSADCSREKGDFGSSEDDNESWRERLTPIGDSRWLVGEDGTFPNSHLCLQAVLSEHEQLQW